jgi:hypothetical protein
MADKEFITCVLEQIRANNNIKVLVGGSIDVYVAKFIPVNKKDCYITVDIDEGESEAIFPACRKNLQITINIKKGSQYGTYTIIKKIQNEIRDIFNREGGKFNDLDNGLRVASVLKAGGENDYYEDGNLYYGIQYYEVVISEGETFTEADAGDKAWS